MLPEDSRHGSYAGANAHWASGVPICEPCKAAATKYHKARKLRLLAGQEPHVPILGTRRRIQALSAIGWSYNQIGEVIGVTRNNVRRLATDETYTKVTRETAEKVKECYRQMSMTLPDNSNRRRDYFRTRATTLGWAPPLAWDDIDNDPEPIIVTKAKDEQIDEIAVQRFLSGDDVALTHTERRAVLFAWEKAGRSLASLERRSGWNVARMRREVAA